MDSRLRGNDINCLSSVIPAKAGIHSAYPNTNAASRRAVRLDAMREPRAAAPGSPASQVEALYCASRSFSTSAITTGITLS